MPAKKKKVKTKLSKEPTWDEIGKAIGMKFEKYKDEECCTPWSKPWLHHHKEVGGGCGRFLFITGILYAMNLVGTLPNLPWWIWVWVVIGFSMMRL